jgi:hypothetical protein
VRDILKDLNVWLPLPLIIHDPYGIPNHWKGTSGVVGVTYDTRISAAMFLTDLRLGGFVYSMWSQYFPIRSWAEPHHVCETVITGTYLYGVSFPVITFVCHSVLSPQV